MNPHNLSLLCPSRQRPSSAVRLVESVERTTSLPHLLEILFYIDSDDPTIEQYDEQLTGRSHPLDNVSVELVIGPPMSVSKSWNELASRANGDVFLMANDDQVYVTPLWDVRLNQEIAKFPDDIYCIYFDDGIWSAGNHCAFPIVSKKWVDALGYFTPGVFLFFYNDTWIFDIAKRIGRAHFIRDILVEHLHPLRGASFGDSMHGRHAGALIPDSAEYYSSSGRDARERAAELLRGLMVQANGEEGGKR